MDNPTIDLKEESNESNETSDNDMNTSDDEVEIDF